MIHRNEKGQFLRTTGARRYKSKGYKGKDIQLSRWVWIKQYGEIPKGNIIHHINGNKFDNRIENLKCMTLQEHNILHCTGREPWNKGMTTKDNPKWKDAFNKSLKVRAENYLKKCKIIYDYKNSTGKTFLEMVPIFNISDRQLCSGYSHYKNYLNNNKMEVYDDGKKVCEKCKQRRRISKKGMCRKCYERRNTRSKFYKVSSSN